MTPDDELLSAYLAGDVDEVTARRVDAAVREDPDVGRRLDELAAVLIALRRPHDVAPPEGYVARLQTRLDRTTRPAPTPAADPPVRRPRRWAWVTGAAAAVAVLAIGGNVLSGFGGGDAEEAALDAAPQVQMETADEPGVADRDVPEEADDGQPQATAPVIIEDEAVLADDDAVRAHFADLPETEVLLGFDVGAAGPVAAAHRVALQRAAPFAAGVAPAACLEVVTAGATGPVVAARVQPVEVEGEQLLAYVLVGASVQATALDRVEVWLVAPDTCETRAFLTLPS